MYYCAVGSVSWADKKLHAYASSSISDVVGRNKNNSNSANNNVL